ncbi:MAG: hypothetical protein CMH52_12940 [Myxococcales bacterium]|nr:hypothetical protein [Myxococcales bacterium]
MPIRLLLSTVIALNLSACLIDDDLGDDVREVRARLTTAALTIDEANAARVDFVFEYLLGLIDKEGIDDIQWTYALIDTDGFELASETQVMRDAQLDRTEIFVQGERPRQLALGEWTPQPDVTYILKVSLGYRMDILHEHFAAFTLAQPHEDLSDIGDIPQFSTR